MKNVFKFNICDFVFNLIEYVLYVLYVDLCATAKFCKSK